MFGAAIIHFFGGIHEIYFPYVLMKPTLILAAMGGGMTGILIETMTGAGLRSPAAPGSIIAVIGSTANDSYVGVVLGVFGAATVSFLIASAILRFSKQGDDDLAEATAKMEGMRARSPAFLAHLLEDRKLPRLSLRWSLLVMLAWDRLLWALQCCVIRSKTLVMATR